MCREHPRGRHAAVKTNEGLSSPEKPAPDHKALAKDNPETPAALPTHRDPGRGKRTRKREYSLILGAPLRIKSVRKWLINPSFEWRGDSQNGETRFHPVPSQQVQLPGPSQGKSRPPRGPTVWTGICTFPSAENLPFIWCSRRMIV